MFKKFMLVFFVLISLQLSAAEMLKMDVKRQGKRFYLKSSLLVEVPVSSMYTILTDYNNMHHFSRGIKHSQEVTPSAEGVRRVYSHLQGCVAFLCRSVEKVELMKTIENQQVLTELLPEISKNVKWNKSLWELSEIQKVDSTNPDEFTSFTKIEYAMEFEPGFWVPPLLGPYMIKKSLAKDGLEIVSRMEKYAQGRSDITLNENSNFPLLEFPQVNYLEDKKIPESKSDNVTISETTHSSE